VASPVKVTGIRIFGRKVSTPRKYALRGHMECLSSLFEISSDHVFSSFP
jgi:hypothetical protein